MILEHECARCRFFRRKPAGTYDRGQSSCYCIRKAASMDDPSAKRWTYVDPEGVPRIELSARERRYCAGYEPHVLSDAELKEM